MIDSPTSRLVGEDSLLVAARAAFPVVDNCFYLNSASVGAVSSIYAKTLAQHSDGDVFHGRALADHFEQIEHTRTLIRKELARILDVHSDRLVLTQGTTSGIEAVVDSLRWEPGDEVICTDLEYDSCRLTLERAASRYQLSLRVARIDQTDLTDVGGIADLISSRTKLIAFSETSFECGLRLPVEKIVAIARSAGAVTLMDAAQAFGVVPLNLRESDVDFCAMPLQKWLSGPEGLGVLYVRPGLADHVSHSPVERVVHGKPILEATLAQLRWQREELSWNWIYQQIAALAKHAQHAFKLIPRSRLLTPMNQGGITTIGFEGVATAQIAGELEQRRFLVRHLQEINAFRIATACFNTTSEIDALVEALTEIVERKP